MSLIFKHLALQEGQIWACLKFMEKTILEKVIGILLPQDGSSHNETKFLRRSVKQDQLANAHSWRMERDNKAICGGLNISWLSVQETEICNVNDNIICLEVSPNFLEKIKILKIGNTITQ